MTAFEDDTAINDLTHQIPEKLGTPFTSGSFGKVYRCSIKTTKGEVEIAVKVFMTDRSKSVEEFEKRIRRELKVWLRLKHPTIVPLLGIAYVDPPLPALVSQWMSSGTLYIYLEEATTITVSTKVRLAKGIVDGLNYLHSENVVHGDLHPGNVLIDGSGNPCLIDFGLATVEGEAELQLNTTTAERSFNSRWRAPEVIGIERGPERPNFKSDVYSFGGVMFFIFSGDRPWKEKNSIQICITLSKKTDHERPKNILDDQWNLIRQCWYWEPGNRPSAADILVSIDQSKISLQVPASRQSIARQYFKGAVRFIIMMLKCQADQTLGPLHDLSIRTALLPPISLLDITEQISKGSSRYPVAQGSFGDVWKCIRKHPRITVEVAVKCLRLEIPNVSCKTQITERLERHLQGNTQLKHANLLPFLGITRGFGPLPAIVSPWMHRGSLVMLLERDFQQLTLTRMLQILKDVASALQYLHSKNIVHGDLTGNNVLIDENGNALVADHGISIVCAELNGVTFIRSNVRWTAPESFQVTEDDESINLPQLPSDIYSFGCIMLQVFTGKVPYSEFRSDHQVTVQILRGRKPARPVAPPIADAPWDFMQKCWLDEPEHRPSAKEVLIYIQGQLKLLEGGS
ncbi:kinase-like domain-containing protein [Suillus subalutaceus]|uniref:kinase-like domain-containing protein n=1 Tax=Suillus subalutaceus TaxID=48586 RepID=UPI001B8659CD|nr:kinase-like domain-containing protein [Suillus subalutaceus]KAG1831662.1 kinase-like domain-containing protein [Suillus subalutaceus]